MKTQKNITLDDFMRARLGKRADVYLVVGIKISGVLISYDHDALFLRACGAVAHPNTMVLWSAITTVSTPEESDQE